MIWFWILSGILALSAADEYIGPGRWLIISVEKCPEDETYPINFEIAKKKVNRTHDGFHGSMVLNQALDDEFGINIDICKYVDGGCKQIQVLQDDCLCCFARKYAKDNLERGLTLAGIDPPDCPIKQDRYRDLMNTESYPFKTQCNLMNELHGISYPAERIAASLDYGELSLLVKD